MMTLKCTHSKHEYYINIKATTVDNSMYKGPFIPIGKLDIVKAYYLNKVGKTLFSLSYIQQGCIYLTKIQQKHQMAEASPMHASVSILVKGFVCTTMVHR